ncbi:MAG: AAA family ATPase [Mycobacterium sp.]
MPGPGLIVLAGPPGTGKSAVAAPLAKRLRAAYLRIDTIEQSLLNSGELSAAPYAVGYLDWLRAGSRPTAHRTIDGRRVCQSSKNHP